MLTRSVLTLSLVVIAFQVRLPAAELDYPLSIAVAQDGTIYLADRNVPGVWKVHGGKRTLYFEGSRIFRTPLNAIRCVAIDDQGNLLAGDSATRDVYRFDSNGKPIGLTQTGAAEIANADQTPADNDANAASQGSGKSDQAGTEPAKTSRPKFVFGQVGIPMDIAVDKKGDLFVSDLEIHRIVKVAKAGGTAKEFVQVQAPRGLCIDAQENVWVLSGRSLVKISPAGEKSIVVEEGTFSFPHTVAVSSDGTAFVCDGYEKCIWKVSSGGKPEKLVAGEPLINPVGMRLVGDKLYVVDPRAKAVFTVTLDGKIETVPME